MINIIEYIMSEEGLDVIFLSHLEILSVVLVFSGINHDWLSLQVMIQHLIKGNALSNVSLVIVTDSGKSSAFDIFTCSQNVIILFSIFKSFSLVFEDGEEETPEHQSRNHSKNK